MLWDSLKLLTDELKALSLKCKLWVDGSFLTEKIDPDDVDLVIEIDIDHLNAATPAAHAFINRLINLELHLEPRKLHTFLIYTAPIGHVEYANGVMLKARWQKDFGFSLKKKTPKGIPVWVI